MFTYTYIHIRLRIDNFVCICVRLYAHTCVEMCVDTYVYTHACIYTQKPPCIYVCVLLICTCVFVSVYICACKHMYVLLPFSSVLVHSLKTVHLCRAHSFIAKIGSTELTYNVNLCANLLSAAPSGRIVCACTV